MSRDLSRRTFLVSAAAAGLVGTVAAAEQREITLGFSLYGMKTVPLDDALMTCAKIGFRNVELALNPGWHAEPRMLDTAARAALRSRLAALKLEVSGLMLNMSLIAADAAHEQAMESLRDAAKLSHDLSPGDPPLIETVLGGKPAEWEQIKDRMAARLKTWAEVAEAGQINLALKAHVGSAVNSPDRLLWLLQQVPSPALCVAYDYSHFEVQGIPLEASLEALLPRTRFVHVKDTTGDASKFQFLLPGDGRTDYATYFQQLRKRRYAGPVVVEVSAQVFNKPDYDPIAAAKKTYAALSAALSRA